MKPAFLLFQNGTARGLQRYTRRSNMMRSAVNYLLPALALLATAIALPAQTQPQERTNSEAAFKQLASVAGIWEGTQDGVATPIKETYTLIANGSALMVHTKPAGDADMLTMLSVDGDRVIATHYCSAQNQPEMISSGASDLHKGMSFSFSRVTGMKTPDDWHNTGLTIKLDDKDHMTQWWNYLYKGQTGTVVFHYTRKK
jgi:hypothetical protein